MGSLKPNAVYIYERVDDVIYRREQGTTERHEVGRDYNLYDQVQEDKLWGEIRRKAKTHAGLKEELDRVIMFYNLINDNK